MLLILDQVALVVKNSPATAGDARDVRPIPDQQDPLGGGMAIHPVFPPEEAPRLASYSPGSQRVRHD